MCMWLKKITQCFLVMVLFIMTTAQPVLAEENDNNQTSLTELNKEKGDVKDIPLSFIDSTGSKTSESYGYDHALYMEKGNTSKYAFTIETEKDYYLSIDYLTLTEGLVSVQGGFKIDGKAPYKEASRYIFSPLWENESNEFGTDRKGNEVMPSQVLVKKWQNAYLSDTNGKIPGFLKIHLTAGKHTLEYTQNSGEMLLGNLSFVECQEYISYDDYKKNHQADSVKQYMQVIEAEKTTYKNSMNVYPQVSGSINVEPYDTYKNLLNTLHMYENNSRAIYNIEVNETGFYQLAFKVEQSKKNCDVYYDILVDGQIPFMEAQGFAFSETKGFEVVQFPQAIYLEKGNHTLTLQVNGTIQEELQNKCTEIYEKINEISLDIKKIVGNNKDTFRDWDLLQYLPNLSKDLSDMAKQLEENLQLAIEINQNQSEVEAFDKIRRIIDNLNEMAEEPNELPNNLSLLSEGTGSVAQSLMDAHALLIDQSLTIDQIYIKGTDETIPFEKKGFFTSFVEGAKQFFHSFLNDSEEAFDDDLPVLNVWVNRNQNMVDLMQKFADEKFTKEYGIHVNFSLMPNEQKLILSNTSGKQPDIALGVSTQIPYEFAIRNAALDLTQFEDFAEVSKRFSPGSLISYITDDKVSALPETQDFYVTFYRKDILNKLNIPVPDTWDEVKEILPELQRFGMNYYIPLASVSGSKPFMFTAPFIYQNGGSIYNEETLEVALDESEAIAGIKMMSELFTVYGLPQQVPSFYNHFRYGTLPIGITSMGDYQKLLVAAPEIANNWDLALYPGIEQDGEIVRWAPGSAQASMAFAETKYPDECWQFLKWWTSAEIQSEFAFQIQNIYGNSYLWCSANLEAFKELPIQEEHKEVILQQWEYLREVPKLPGGYVVEREISNIWTDIVFNGENARAAIDNSLITMNKELARKLEEFGYMKDGKIVKPYPIPSIEEIKKWGEEE